MAKEEHCKCGYILLLLLFIFPVIDADARKSPINALSTEPRCDLFHGKWIPYLEDPPYDETCSFISNLQNCILNNHTDRNYLHWRWKPHGCDLPFFVAEKFLDAMRDKAFAFIGDSIARSQIESLLCLLSKTERSILVHHDVLTLNTVWYFPSYNFTLAMIWSPILLQYNNTTTLDKPIEPNLDVLDDNWVDKYRDFDYVLIGIGAWFQPSKLNENGKELDPNYVYRRALELAFRFVTESGHKPFVIYRIHTPNHFEHGRWDKGGYCNRTEPFEEGEFAGDVRDQELEAISREEFAKAVTKVNNMVMLDVYHLSLLRPDGHLDKYHWVGHDKHDCLHWCLPGAIDTWNDLMMEMVTGNEKNLRHPS